MYTFCFSMCQALFIHYLIQSSSFPGSSYSHFIDVNIEAKRLTASSEALLLESSDPFLLLHGMTDGEICAAKPHWVPWSLPDRSPREF